MHMHQHVNKNLSKECQIDDLTWMYIDQFHSVTDPDIALELVNDFCYDWHKIQFPDRSEPDGN